MPADAQLDVARYRSIRLWHDRGVADDDGASVEAAVRAALPSSLGPWTVTSRTDRNGSWTIEVTHVASNGLIIETGVSDAMTAIARARDVLAHSRELERVARAPRIVHPDAINGLRASVQVFGWSQTEARAMARLLEEVGALDGDKTGWFETLFGEDRRNLEA